MTVAQTELVEHTDSVSAAGDAERAFSRRLRRYRLGLGLVICGIVMLFASFFSAYVVRKGVANYDYSAQGYSTEWQSFKLPAAMLGLATASLLLAGVTLEIARRKALRAATQSQTGKARNGLWIWSAIIATCGFLVFVAGAWQVLGSEGHRINSGAQAAFFYLLTGVHSLHVVIAPLFLLYIALRRNWRIDDQSIAVDLSAWYCYSMGALWLCVMLLFLI